MKLLLENWKSYLAEEAIEDISKMGIFYEEDESLIVIYEYLPVLAKIRRAVYQDPDKFDISEHIVGVARLGWRDGHYVIEEIWTERGYGPTLYRMAIEKSGRHGISPSIVKGQVSEQASNVWKQFYDGRGSQYTKHQPLEKKVHGVEHLDSLYFLDGPEVNKTKALSNHKKIFNSRRDPYDELITYLLETASSLLRDKMAEVGY